MRSPLSLVSASFRLTAAVLLAGLPAAAQTETSPYAGLEGREIKALSAEEIEALLDGAGMGFAMAAELNRYPGPKHVLELAGELGLSAEQRAATERVFEEMRTEARALGAELVEGERQLDCLFRAGEVSGETLDRQVAAIAALRGRLRAAHLRAHLRMREILSADQVARYVELRGYESAGQGPAAHHDGHAAMAGHGGGPPSAAAEPEDRCVPPRPPG